MPSYRFVAADTPCRDGELALLKDAIERLTYCDEDVDFVLAPLWQSRNLTALHRALLDLRPTYRARARHRREDLSTALHRVRPHSSLRASRSCTCVSGELLRQLRAAGEEASVCTPTTPTMAASFAVPNATVRLWAAEILEHPDPSSIGPVADVYTIDSRGDLLVELLRRLRVDFHDVTRCEVHVDTPVVRLELAARGRCRFRARLIGCDRAQEAAVGVLPHYCDLHPSHLDRASQVQAWPDGWARAVQLLSQATRAGTPLANGPACSAEMTAHLEAAGIGWLAGASPAEQARVELALAELGPGWSGRSLLELAACVTGIAR